MIPQSIINRMVEGTTEAMDALLFRLIMGFTFVLENVFTSNEHRAAIGAKAHRTVGERDLICDCQVKSVGYRRENQVQKKCTNYPKKDNLCRNRDNNPIEDNRCRNRDDLIECDVNCHPNCCNRPFVANQMMKERFRVEHYQGRGFGLKTLVSIERGQFVMQYTGLIRYVEERDEDNMADELNYAYRIRGTPFVVDGKFMGNQARYINHSCEPNLIAYSYVTQGTIKIVLEAIKPIHAGQELTLNYFDVIQGYPCRCGSEACQFLSPNQRAKEDEDYQSFRKQEKLDKLMQRLFGSDDTKASTPVARRTRSKKDGGPPTSCSSEAASTAGTSTRRPLSADPCECLSDPNPRKARSSKSSKKSRAQSTAQKPLHSQGESLNQSIRRGNCAESNDQLLSTQHDDEVPSTSAACRQELEAMQRQSSNNNNDDDQQVPSTSQECRRNLAEQQQLQQQYPQLPVDPRLIKQELGERSKLFLKSRSQPDHFLSNTLYDWETRLSQSPELEIDNYHDYGDQEHTDDEENPLLFIDIATPSPVKSVPASPCRPQDTSRRRQGSDNNSCVPCDLPRTPEMPPCISPTRTPLRGSSQRDPTAEAALVPFSNVSLELEMDLDDRPDLSPNAILRSILAPRTPTRRRRTSSNSGNEAPTTPGNNIAICPGLEDYRPMVPCLDDPLQLCAPDFPYLYRDGPVFPPRTPGRQGSVPPTTPPGRNCVPPVTPPGRNCVPPSTPNRRINEQYLTPPPRRIRTPVTPGSEPPPLTPGRRSNERPWSPLVNLVRALTTPEGRSTRPPHTPGRDLCFLPHTPGRAGTSESPWAPMRRLALTYLESAEREASRPPCTPGRREGSLPPQTPGRGSNERPCNPVRRIDVIYSTPEREPIIPPQTPGRGACIPPRTPPREECFTPPPPTPGRGGCIPHRTPVREEYFQFPPVTPGRGGCVTPLTPGFTPPPPPLPPTPGRGGCVPPRTPLRKSNDRSCTPCGNSAPCTPTAQGAETAEPPCTPGRGQPPFPATLTLVTQQGQPGTPGRLSISYNEQIPRVANKTVKQKDKKKKKKKPQPCEPQPGCSTSIVPVADETACKKPAAKKKKKSAPQNNPTAAELPPSVVINVGPPPPQQPVPKQKKKATKKGKACINPAPSSSTSTLVIAPQPQPAVRIRLRVPQQVVEVDDNGNDRDCVPAQPKKKPKRQKRQREEYPEDRCESPQPGPSRLMRMDPEVDFELSRITHTRKTRPELGDDSRRHVCHICGERYFRKVDLRDHITRHENKRRHVCPVCGLRFNVLADLRKHLETHKKNRVRYPCPSLNCPATFAKKGGVKRHLEGPCEYNKKQPPKSQVPPPQEEQHRHEDDDRMDDDDNYDDQAEE